MSTIVAGRFKTFPDAEKAAQRLYGRGFNQQDVSVFYVNNAGQHDTFPIGGDEHADPGTKRSPRSSMLAAAVGAVIGLLIGWGIAAVFNVFPVVALIGAGIGAYVGSLMGAMSGTRNAERVHRAGSDTGVRHAGVMVAVRVEGEKESDATTVLREVGGDDVERSDGEWQNGKWVDFDPVQAPVLSHKEG